MNFRRTAAATAVALSGAAALSMGSIVPAFAGGAGCHSSTPTSGTGSTVDLAGACFTPNVLHVKVGDTVTWTSREDLDHTVTGTARSFGDYNTIKIGQSVSYRFTKNGVYPYFCMVHPGMAAAIVVGDGSGPGPAEANSVIAAPAPQAPARSDSAAAPSSANAAARTSVSLWPWGLLGILGLVVGAIGGLLVGRRAAASA